MNGGRTPTCATSPICTLCTVGSSHRLVQCGKWGVLLGQIRTAGPQTWALAQPFVNRVPDVAAGCVLRRCAFSSAGMCAKACSIGTTDPPVTLTSGGAAMGKRAWKSAKITKRPNFGGP